MDVKGYHYDDGNLHGQPYSSGTVSATLLAANLELSFWGGVAPDTGEVIDRFHPLSGQHLKSKILAIPGGRGSCGGSAVILELILNGLGPKALIFQRPEDIITFGVMVAEEMFERTLPIILLDPSQFRELIELNGSLVSITGNVVHCDKIATPLNGTIVYHTRNLDLALSEVDEEILRGAHGEAAKIAMKILLRTANMMGAREFIDISQAHIDPAWYGPGSVLFGTKLRDLGGKFQVPSSMNSLTIDRRRWEGLGIDPKYGSECDELAKAYRDMNGAEPYTCTPYNLSTAPKFGELVAWGESNAVAYANSVLGARTLKAPNMMEALMAIAGRAPRVGVYLDSGRHASKLVRVPSFDSVDDSFWPILGYSIGALASNSIPAITGLEHMRPTKDDFKAFSAAFATSSSVAMYHMVGLTPEAPTLEAACGGNTFPQAVDLEMQMLAACWQEFNNGLSARSVDLVSLGNPHFSFRELKALAQLCEGRAKNDRVFVLVTCSSSHYSLASQAGYVQRLVDFGVEFLTDKCWCSIEEPVIPKDAKVIMTNSGKYAHYGPGLTGRTFCFGSLEMCVAAACTGVSDGRPPAWMRMVESKHS